MSEDCCPPDEDTDSKLTCPECETEARSVSYETMYHLLEQFTVREVNPEQTYGVCRERSCSVLYFSSDHSQTWQTSETRTTVGFKQPENDSPHPVCYCFGYTEENIAEEIEDTGESTVAEWITERVQNEECACEYKNPTGRCCLGDVRGAVKKAKSK
jgi:hypothetical protein